MRDPAAIVEAAKLADVHDLIQRLPEGYNTRIGEAGSKLSAGQRQRIALARALFGSPVLLVLDEPNSNLDLEGDVALENAIRTMKERGVAIVIIAHRPSALTAVDRIMVMKEGRAVEYGPRDEILRKVTMRPAQPQQPRPALAVVSEGSS